MFQVAQKLISEAVNLTFIMEGKSPGQEVAWNTLLVGEVLLVDVPCSAPLEGTNESFVAMLEHAEDILKCSKVVICFKKSGPSRNLLIRTFMFLGFSLIPPSPGGCHGDLLYMSYSIREDDGESQSDED